MTAHALAGYLWPLSRIGEALELLAVEAGFGHGRPDLPAPPPDITWAVNGLPPGLALTRWIENAASHLGLEAEPIEARFGNVATLIRKAGPALLRVQGNETVFLLLLGTRRSRARLLGIDRRVALVDVESVRSLLCLELEAPLRRSLEGVLTTAGVRPRDGTIDAILQQQLGGVVIRGFWMLRWPPSSPLRELAIHLGLRRRVAVFFIVHALEYAIWLASWWAVGRGILSGRIDTGWLWAWGLLLFTAIPLHLLATWLAGLFAIDAAALLRQRLLAGAMQLDPGEIKGRGAGALLGLVFEADAVEALAFGGGLIAVMAIIEIAMTAAILCLGPAALWEVGTLAAGVILTGTLAWRYYRQRREWTRARLALTDDLVEGIVGISTRVVQEHPDDWHVREDAKLTAYLQEFEAPRRDAGCGAGPHSPRLAVCGRPDAGQCLHRRKRRPCHQRRRRAAGIPRIPHPHGWPDRPGGIVGGLGANLTVAGGSLSRTAQRGCDTGIHPHRYAAQARSAA